MSATLESRPPAASQPFDIGTAFEQFMNGIGLSSQDCGGTITFVG